MYDFQTKKEQTLRPFKLPTYQVQWLQTAKQENLKLHPQVSYFQSPLLEIAPDIIQQLAQNSSEPKANLKFLGKYQPLINQYLLPTTQAGAKQA